MYKKLLLASIITANLAAPELAGAAGAGTAAGAVYAMTNDTAGNAIVVYERYADGSLALQGSYATGGLGGFAGDTADALGSQGALTLNQDKSLLYAVNAGSDSISVFRVLPHGLALVQTIASGGQFPVSLALYQDLLYVLNSGGDGNITGFSVGPSGRVMPISGSTRSLDAGGTNPPSFIESPAQVGFDPSGRWLVVTLKEQNEIYLYSVDDDGVPSTVPVINESSGSTPFGFAFDGVGHLIVAEPFGPAEPGVGEAGAASSYVIGEDGALTPISSTVVNYQTATCWMALEPRGRFAFATNNVSSTITGYRVDYDGSLELLDADGITAESNARPVDLGVTSDGHYLYSLNAGTGTVASYRVDGHTGALTFIGEAGGLPEDQGVAGLAVR